MGRRYWRGRRRDKHGPEGDGCWFCIHGSAKRKILRDRAWKRERDALRRLRDARPLQQEGE